MSVPFHNNEPDAGPSLTAIPPRFDPIPFSEIMLSPISKVVESTVVVVPDTVKFPDNVKFVNVGLSLVPKAFAFTLTPLNLI